MTPASSASVTHALDLTPFGFTPTESLVYEILVSHGPGTGYAVARSAGLARANAYSALEGLVGKGAARADDGRPRRYRPEPAPVLLGRIVDRQSQAIEQLAHSLDRVVAPTSPTLVEVTSLRGVGQLLTLEIARARHEVEAFLPARVWPMLVPAVRRAAASGVTLSLFAEEPVPVDAAPIEARPIAEQWPGKPVLAAIDDRVGLIAMAEGDRVSGHWSSTPTVVAAARLAIKAIVQRENQG
jgi:HTH-type transcriptional regulator, sugar sensing transcriptional regulator